MAANKENQVHILMELTSWDEVMMISKRKTLTTCGAQHSVGNKYKTGDEAVGSGHPSFLREM